MRARSVSVAVLVGGMAIAAAVNAYGAELNSDSVTAGKKLAERLCATCHVVAPQQDHALTRFPPAPAFEEIAHRPGIDAASLERFLETTHWDMKSLPMTMPDFGITAKDRSDAAAYILSLRQQRE
jgi:mono/diheme cytochrome c family protein